MSIVSKSFVIAASTILTGCGGGGGSASEYGSPPTPTTSSASNADTSTPSNVAPSFTDLPLSVSVNENQKSIITVDATDGDSDQLTFSLRSGDSDALTINSETGVLSFLAAPDFEAKASYQTEVVVTDGSASTAQTVTIQVIDIAETSSEAPLEINVTVARGDNGYGSGNKYYINGSASPDVTLEAGKTYRFLQSDGSNATHPIRLSTSENGVHSGGSDYSSNVEYVANAGNPGAYLQFTVPLSGIPETIYYYCLNHSGMGGRIFISSASGTDYQVVRMN